MIQLRINDEIVLAHASPLTWFIYRQEFDSDIYEDTLIAINEEYNVVLGRLAWAMVKTVEPLTPSFIQWVQTIDDEIIEVNKVLIIYELGQRILFEVKETTKTKTKTKESKHKIELGFIKTIINLGIEVSLVNLMSTQSFIELQDMYIDDENRTEQATPKQVDAFFLGV